MKRSLSSTLVAMITVVFGCSNAHQEGLLYHEPFALDEFQVWRDGGSLSFVFLCGGGEKLSFRLDGRIGSPTAGYFFLEVNNSKEKLPLGGTKEKSLIAVLEKWLDSKFTDDDLNRISNSTDFPNMTKDEFRAWHIKRVVDGRLKTIKHLNRK